MAKHHWKGDNITYSTIHWWNNKNYSKSGICKHCGITGKRTEWALKKGKNHSRGIQNYIELCKRCHIKYDKTEAWTKKTLLALDKTYSHKNPIQVKKCKQCLKEFFPKRKTSIFCSTKCSANGTPRQVRQRDKITGRWLELNK
jgi:hypothetical protein